jgi:hypothetical protein
MLRHVEKLRQKPEHLRRRWAFGLSAGATGLVAIVWIFSVVASGGPFGSSAAVASDSSSNLSPLSAMQASAASAFQSLVGSNPFNSSSEATSSPGLNVVNQDESTQ